MRFVLAARKCPAYTLAWRAARRAGLLLLALIPAFAVCNPHGALALQQTDVPQQAASVSSPAAYTPAQSEATMLAAMPEATAPEVTPVAAAVIAAQDTALVASAENALQDTLPYVAAETTAPNAALVTSAASTPSAAAASVSGGATPAFRAAFVTKLNAVFARYATLGAVVCVVENGSVSETFCYGLLSPDGTPMTENVLFRVGSISKMVAAMGVMQLVEQGRVTLEDDLADILQLPVRNPSYPDTPITLRQLMSHTAGFRDSGSYTRALRGEPRPLSELLTPPLQRYTFLGSIEPGVKSAYSNLGGGLLGSVIEQVTGQTVDAYLYANLFAPLGITAAYQSALLAQTAVVSNMYTMPGRRLSASVVDGTAAYFEADAQHHYTLTAGKLTISAPDLAKLLIALMDGGVYGDVRVLTEESALSMRQVQNGIGSVTGNSGFGLNMTVLEGLVAGRTLYGHGGKANGMLCTAYFDPTDRTGIVMLTNGCNNIPMEENVGKLSLAVMRLVYTQWLEALHELRDPWLVE